MTTKKTCVGCTAICCRYITIEINNPKTKKDFDKIKKYLSYKNIQINVEEDGSWFLKFYSNCKYLDGQNLCTRYKNRPAICKEHKIKDCERYNKENFLLTFNSLEEFEKYEKNIQNRSTTF